MKKGFTLIEVVVAVGLLAMVIAFSSVIFKVSIETRRTAGANAEIIQKLWAITNQLNRDFAGLQTDAPLAIWFQQDVGASGELNRYDQILFFAAGDFSTYWAKYGGGTPPNDILKGNVARIWYGQARDKNNTLPLAISKPKDRILARNQHILTQDADCNDWPKQDYSLFDQFTNERYEYDKLSLAQWELIDQTIFDTKIVQQSLADAKRVHVDVSDANTFNNLMCKGVGSFAVQWGYKYINTGVEEWRWWPNKADFAPMNGTNPFGAFFNVINPTGVGFDASGEKWHVPTECKYDNGSGSTSNFAPGYYPQALKFTFRIYDSKGIIKDGRTFTHIVYLGN